MWPFRRNIFKDTISETNFELISINKSYDCYVYSFILTDYIYHVNDKYIPSCIVLKLHIEYYPDSDDYNIELRKRHNKVVVEDKQFSKKDKSFILSLIKNM